ncbi:MotA/TolQ/ExbB proton channel family protein [Planctomycetota bacterium]
MKPGRILAFAAAFLLLALLWGWGFGGLPVTAATARAVAVVLAVPYLFLLVSHSPQEMIQALRDPFATDHTDTPVERLVASTQALQALGRYSLAVGVLGTFWALLANMEALAMSPAPPNLTDMAPMLSQAFLLPAIGASLRWFVYTPLATTVEAAQDPLEGLGD